MKLFSLFLFERFRNDLDFIRKDLLSVNLFSYLSYYVKKIKKVLNYKEHLKSRILNTPCINILECEHTTKSHLERGLRGVSQTNCPCVPSCISVENKILCIDESVTEKIGASLSGDFVNFEKQIIKCIEYLEEKLRYIKIKKMCSSGIEALVRNNLGAAYERINDKKWARIMFESAYELSPSNAVILDNLQRINYKINKAAYNFSTSDNLIYSFKHLLTDVCGALITVGICVYLMGFSNGLIVNHLNSDEILNTPYWLSEEDVFEAEKFVKPEAALKDIKNSLNKTLLEEEKNRYVLQKYLDRLYFSRVKYVLPPELERSYTKIAQEAQQRFAAIESYYNYWGMETEAEVFGWTYQELFDAGLLNYKNSGETSLKELLANLRRYFLMEREWSEIFDIDVAKLSQPITISESNVREAIKGKLHSPDTGIRQINSDTVFNTGKNGVISSFLTLMCSPPAQKDKSLSDVIFKPEFAFRVVYTDHSVEPDKSYNWKELLIAFSKNPKKWEPVLMDLLSRPIHNFALAEAHVSLERQHPFYTTYLKALRAIPTEQIRDLARDHKYDELKILYIGYMGGPRRIRSWFNNIYLSGYSYMTVSKTYDKFTAGQLYSKGHFDVFVNRQISRIVENAKKVEFFHRERVLLHHIEIDKFGSFKKIIDEELSVSEFLTKYPNLYNTYAPKFHNKYIQTFKLDDTKYLTHLGDGFFTVTKDVYERLSPRIKRNSKIL